MDLSETKMDKGGHLKWVVVKKCAAARWSCGLEMPPGLGTQKAVPGLALLFVKSGTGEFTSKNGRVLAAKGAVVVCSLDSAAYFCPAKEGEVEFGLFSATFEQLTPLLGGFEICRLPRVVARLGMGKVHAPQSPVARECRQLLEQIPPQPGLPQRGQLLRIAAAVLAEEFKSAETDAGEFDRLEERVSQVLGQMPSFELTTLSVETLAGKVGCSRRHLTRIFQRHFGATVAGVRTELRLMKAIYLLRNPAAKIVDVAQESGYDHLGLFHRAFRKRFKCSPAEWRRLAAAAGGAEAPENRPVTLRLLEERGGSPAGWRVKFTPAGQKKPVPAGATGEWSGMP